LHPRDDENGSGNLSAGRTVRWQAELRSPQVRENGAGRPPGKVEREEQMAGRRPLRVGIVGVGWGALVHAPAFRAVPEFELVALCSRNAERVTEAGAKLGLTDVSTDWEDFVWRDDLDVISVCAPVGLHVPVSLAALAAGKHVLCEKPLALSGADAQTLYDAGAQTDRATAVCFELRWTPHKYNVWRLAEEGFIGVPYFVRVSQSAGYWHPSSHPQSEWMYRRGEGGGYLMGQTSHEIDFVCKVFGEAVAVCADVKTSVPRRTLPDGRVIEVDADDTANVLLRLANGASVVLSNSVVGVHATGYALDAFGENGTLSVGVDGKLRGAQPHDQGMKDMPLSDRQPRSGVDLGMRRSSNMVRATALLLEDWLPAFDGEPAPKVPSLRDGWRVQRIVDAARRSSEGGGWINL
jgi:predicted dehydrogenase